MQGLLYGERLDLGGWIQITAGRDEHTMQTKLIWEVLVGEESEKGRGRERRERKWDGVAKGLLGSSEKHWEKESGSRRSMSLKGTFCTWVRVCLDANRDSPDTCLISAAFLSQEGSFHNPFLKARTMGLKLPSSASYRSNHSPLSTRTNPHFLAVPLPRGPFSFKPHLSLEVQASCSSQWFVGFLTQAFWGV